MARSSAVAKARREGFAALLSGGAGLDEALDYMLKTFPPGTTRQRVRRYYASLRPSLLPLAKLAPSEVSEAYEDRMKRYKSVMRGVGLRLKGMKMGPLNPNWGDKARTDESRRKHKEKMIGRARSEETKRKISESHMGAKNPMYGKKLSLEQKENLRRVNLGRQHTAEEIEKIRQSKLGEKNPNWGKHLLTETIEKIRASLKRPRDLAVAELLIRNRQQGRKGILTRDGGARTKTADYAVMPPDASGLETHELVVKALQRLPNDERTAILVAAGLAKGSRPVSKKLLASGIRRLRADETIKDLMA